MKLIENLSVKRDSAHGLINKLRYRLRDINH